MSGRTVIRTTVDITETLVLVVL